MSAFLGIDTSNYTTSAAIYFSESSSIIQQKKLLEVKLGERGLRQSDALFQHTKNLPEVLHKLFCDTSESIGAVGVSVRPRDLEGSYMPCFLAGVSAASVVHSVDQIPMYEFSHQRGHIMAALYSADKLEYVKKPFLAFHISGGTTEAIYVKPDEEKVISCEQIITTSDVNAGQIIDRAGVMLGLKFPCGAKLEELAQNGTARISYPITVKNNAISFSGIENYCKDLIKDNANPSDVARFTLETVGKAIIAMADATAKEYGKLPMVFSGGVMSDDIIKDMVLKKYDAVFAKREFSCDNAAGIAVLTAFKEGFI